MFKKKHIVFVLDDKQIKQTVEKFSKYFDCLTFIKNKEDALAYIEKNKDDIDLLVVDANIGDNTGLQIVQNLKTKSSKEIKTVIVSDKEHPEDFIKAIELKIDNFFIKPFEHIELMEKVLHLLKEEEQLEELSQSKLFNLNYIRILNEIVYVARIDANKKINFVNERFLTLLEYSFEELQAMEYDFTASNAIDFEDINSKSSWEGVIQYISKSKVITYMNVTISAIYDQEGKDILEYILIAYKVDNLEEYKKKFKNMFFKEKMQNVQLSTKLKQLQKRKIQQKKEYQSIKEALAYRKEVLGKQKEDIQVLGTYTSQFKTTSAEVVSIHQKMLDNLTIKAIELEEISKKNNKQMEKIEQDIKLYSKRIRALKALQRES